MKHKTYPTNKKRAAIILAGANEFGRCELALTLPRVLWPLEGQAVILRLLRKLYAEGIDQIVICAAGDTEIVRRSVVSNAFSAVTFLDEILPVGTAGCLRDAAHRVKADEYLVINGTIAHLPPMTSMLNAHERSDNAITMFICSDAAGAAVPAGIYVCSHAVTDLIPSQGYVDIKETLLPAIWRAGLKAAVATIEEYHGGFRTIEEYIETTADHVDHVVKLNHGNAQIHAAAHIDATARLLGPLLIMSGVRVGPGAVITGPTILESGVVIGENALVDHSVLWQDCVVGSGAQLFGCVAGFSACIAPHAVLRSAVVPCKVESKKNFARAAQTVAFQRDKVQKTVKPLLARCAHALGLTVHPDTRPLNAAVSLAIIAAALLWLYWSDVRDLWEVWTKSDEYSSGMLVPVLAGYIVWTRRKQLLSVMPRPDGYGILLFLLGQAIRLFGLIFMYASAQRISLLVSMAGILLLLFGRRFLWGLAPILLFLVLAIPVPRSVHASIMAPLQNLATSSAVFSLELLGFEVERQGNVIHIGDVSVAVAEACNGLRMITAFFVISALVVLLIERCWWEKLIVLLSALPIGLLCNTVRLTGTAIAFTRIKAAAWESVFHDFGGLAMMPLALSIVVGELWLLKRVTRDNALAPAEPIR